MSNSSVGFDNNRFINQAQLLVYVSLSSNTVRKLESEGRFPKRRRVGLRAVRWWLPDVEEWLKNPEMWQAE